MFVSNAMTRHVQTVEPQSSLQEIWDLMQANNYEAVPVRDKKRNLVGIVTMADVAEAAMDADEDDFRQTITARDIMVADVTSVSEEEVLEEAAYLMKDKDYTALPVVSSADTLVGIITQADIQKVLVAMLGFTQPGTRISLSVPDRVGRLADVAQIVKQCNVSISGLVTHVPEDASVGNVVLRLKTQKPKPVVQKLRDSGYRVLHVAQLWRD